MAGAGKKRAKADRQAGQQGQHEHEKPIQGHVARFDGPSSRPESSSGPHRPQSGHGPSQSNAPGPSVRSSSRPSSSQGPPAPGQSVRSSSRPPSSGRRLSTGGPSGATGTTPQVLRDPALDPRRQTPRLNTRIEWGGNAFSYYAQDSVSEYS
ncbi:MAG: hypothetical protein Q9220_004899 [cf. Caloplaca sp. 1 TL-2023]